ncbi:MAG: hypothetical protein IKQ58_06755 [Prevotella sp.]|jgi:hypothetical protein|nr:hypothetical protein [Prevotella sp.]
MKAKLFLIVMMAITFTLNMNAQKSAKKESIGYIETTKNWYYIYNQDGKKIRTFTTSQGELKGYSNTFYILKQGATFYMTYDVNGKRLHTFGAGSVGEVIGVSGDTFTSKLGVWIFTWSKEGKKIGTRAAR